MRGFRAAWFFGAVLSSAASCVAVDVPPPEPSPAPSVDAGALAAELFSDDALAREKAFDRLVAAGPEVRPALEKAAGADPERRETCAHVLKEIEWAALPLLGKPEDLAGIPDREAQAIGALEAVASAPEEKPIAPFLIRTPSGSIPLSPGELAMPAAAGRAIRVRGKIRAIERAALGGRPETVRVLEAASAESLSIPEALSAARRIRGFRLQRDPQLRDERERLLAALRRFDVSSFTPEGTARHRALLRRILEIDDGASVPTLAAIASNPKALDAYTYDAVGALAGFGGLEARACIREIARTSAREGLRKRAERALVTGR